MTLSAVELRDLGHIDSLAKEVMRQTGFLRRNMAREPECDDRLRHWFIEAQAERLLAVASRRARVWQKQRAAQ